MLLRDHPETSAFLRAMPKAELHLHLDGCLRTDTILELAGRQGVDLPTRDRDALDAILQPGPDCESLEEYLRAFAITTSVLRDQEALERVAFELCEDAAADNVRYVEVRYSPLFMLDHGLSLDATLGAVQRGLERGRAEHGVLARQIVCMMRDRGPEVGNRLATETVSLAERYGVVAFDLAGGEAGNPPEGHESAYRIAREGLLRSTVHAGEAAGPDSVAGALHALGAERLGHGVALRSDERLRAYVRDRGVTVEMCPTSNVQTRTVADFADHPCLRFLREGLRVTLCTDNTGVSATTLSAEYAAIVQHQDVTLDDVRAWVETGFDAAFLPMAERVALRDDAMRTFDALAAKTFGP